MLWFSRCFFATIFGEIGTLNTEFDEVRQVITKGIKKLAAFICYMGGGADKAIEKLKQCLEVNQFDAELILIYLLDKKSDKKDKKIEEFCEKISK